MSRENVFTEVIDVGISHRDQTAEVCATSENVFLTIDGNTTVLTALQALEISQMLTRATIAQLVEERAL